MGTAGTAGTGGLFNRYFWLKNRGKTGGFHAPKRLKEVAKAISMQFPVRTPKKLQKNSRRSGKLDDFWSTTVDLTRYFDPILPSFDPRRGETMYD